MSQCWQLRALMKKNLILMKRSCCASICEIFFPIFLMMMISLIRGSIKKEVLTYEGDDLEFTKTNSTALVNYKEMKNMKITPKRGFFDIEWDGLSFHYPLLICNERTTVAIVGKEDNIYSKKIVSNIEKLRPVGLFPESILKNLKL